MRTLKAIIFDMDGVIIDSEPQHGRAALKVLHKYGADADMSYHEPVSYTHLDVYKRTAPVLIWNDRNWG